MKILNINRTAHGLFYALLLVVGLHTSAQAENVPNINYQTISVDGVDIFYREAGNPKKSTILLLHGFPTSSHMFRDLIAELADEYHLIAPDYPGYGFSSMPQWGLHCY